MEQSPQQPMKVVRTSTADERGADSTTFYGTTLTVGKPWYRSKTLWFNAISLAVLVLSSPQAAELLPLFPASWQAEIARVIPVVLVAGNAYLRLITSEPITGKKAAPLEM